MKGIRFFLLKLESNALVRNNLLMFNEKIEESFLLCNNESKTVEHFFIRCKFFQFLWMCWYGGLKFDMFTKTVKL